MKLAQIPAREIFRNLAKMLKILQDNANLLKIIALDVVLVSQRSLLETANLQPITCIAGPGTCGWPCFIAAGTHSLLNSFCSDEILRRKTYPQYLC